MQSRYIFRLSNIPILKYKYVTKEKLVHLIICFYLNGDSDWKVIVNVCEGAWWNLFIYKIV